MKLLKTKLFLTALGFIFIGCLNTAKTATIYFNKLYVGTVNSGNFDSTSTVAGNDESSFSLNYFNLHCNEYSHNLYWQTQIESKCDKFIIEVSADGNVWEILDELKATGESTEIQNYEYEVWDIRQNKYYRLIQTDFDGAKTTYEPISSTCNFEKIEVIISQIPNSKF